VNGVHDMGGDHGFGAVRPEPGEPVFHADWERRAFALTLAMGATGTWGLDASRFARESLPPATYLSSSYYEIWLGALERQLAEHGLVSDAEREAGRPLTEHPAPVARTLAAEDVPATLGRGGPTVRDAPGEPRFAAGERVRARNMHPRTHTRLPRYVRDHVGTVESVRGAHVFPDTSAHGLGEQPQWLYTVSFDAAELWGGDADPTVRVSVDAFEPYLQAAS
jgi:nitrile hydratase